jgi:hypothetical protein
VTRTRVVWTSILVSVGGGLLVLTGCASAPKRPRAVITWPCPVPTAFDTTGWVETRFLGGRLALRLPPSFERDETVAFVEGGNRWRDGSRQFDIASDPNPGILSPFAHWRPSVKASVCRDTLDGVPVLIETVDLPSKHIVTACSPVADDIGYYDQIRASSPDSADVHLFHFIIRTLHQTGYPSGTKRKWFGRQAVQVHARTQPDRAGIRYEYRIVNRSTAPISSLRIGFDQDLGLASIGRVRNEWKSQATVVGEGSSPKGWAVKFVRSGENSGGFFEWTAATGKRAVAPGSSLSGFSIHSAKPDEAYWGCHWTAYTSSGNDEPWFSGALIHDPVR